MSIKLPDFIVPAGDSTEFLVEDKYIRGGLHTVPTPDDLALMDPTTLKVGMLCVIQSTLKIFQLKTNELDEETGEKVPVWEEFKAGGGGVGVRQSVTHFENLIIPNAVREFALPLGKCALIYTLEVDTSCQLEAYSTAAMDESNPYLFLATVDHLSDDGSTLMSDGTILRGRRYPILVNMENVGDPATDINIYFRVTNTDTVDKSVNLTISFLPIESI